VQWPARSGAPVRPAPSRPRRPCAALPSAEACPSWSDRRGPRCARLTGRPLNLAQPGRASAPRATRGSGRALARPERRASAVRATAGKRQSPPPRAGGPHGPRSAKPWARPGQARALDRPRFPLGSNCPPRQGRRANSAPWGAARGLGGPLAACADGVGSPLRFGAPLRTAADRSGVRRAWGRALNSVRLGSLRATA